MSQENDDSDLAPLDSSLVYVVDDEPELLDILDSELVSAGFEVMSFSDPSKVLTAVQSRVPDLVISDLKMPGVTGLDLLREVKKICPDTPFILLSGYLTAENLIEAVGNCVDYGIEKPFDMERVVELSLEAVTLKK